MPALVGTLAILVVSVFVILIKLSRPQDYRAIGCSLSSIISSKI